MKNIALVGFMASGKSTISKYLAQKLQLRVVSIDVMIVEKEGRLITDIFKDSGEPYFRAVETQVVAQAVKLENVIIDCGGGVVLAEENIVNLKSNSILIYLSTSPEVIYERAKKETHRPLLNVEDPLGKIKELLTARLPFYQKADFTVTTDDKTIDQISEEIVAIIKK